MLNYEVLVKVVVLQKIFLQYQIIEGKTLHVK